MESKLRIDIDGNKFWELPKGKLHRTDGPAIITAGGRRWYLNGELHRADGPAIEWVNGDKEWWLNGKRHREDGPAVEYPNGRIEWCLNGVRYRTEEEWKQALEVYKAEKIVNLF